MKFVPNSLVLETFSFWSRFTVSDPFPLNIPTGIQFEIENLDFVKQEMHDIRFKFASKNLISSILLSRACVCVCVFFL